VRVAIDHANVGVGFHHADRTPQRPRHQQVVGGEEDDVIAIAGPLQALVRGRDQPDVLLVAPVLDPLVGSR
jgi:hypothetical protein